MGIASAWYKLGTELTKPDDGTRTTSKPIVLASPPEGRQPSFVWLEDGAGNKSERNRAHRLILYDKTPPTGSILINDGAERTASPIVTLKLQAEDTAGDQPRSGLAQMCFSHDCRSWSEWAAFSERRLAPLLKSSPARGEDASYLSTVDRESAVVGAWEAVRPAVPLV